MVYFMHGLYATFLIFLVCCTFGHLSLNNSSSYDDRNVRAFDWYITRYVT